MLSHGAPLNRSVCGDGSWTTWAINDSLESRLEVVPSGKWLAWSSVLSVTDSLGYAINASASCFLLPAPCDSQVLSALNF